MLSARKWENAQGTTRVLFSDVRVEAVGEVPDSMKLTLADAAASEAGKMSFLEFLRQRRDRRYERVPRQVLAFYYPWYRSPERHGGKGSWRDVDREKHYMSNVAHYPEKGPYDSHAPEIIDWHIEVAKSHGLDGFISSWWGQGTFDDQALRLLLERAAERDFKLTVYWEKAPGQGRAQITQAADDLAYLLNEYGAHPAFLKLDGKPVIFVYGRVMGQVPLTSWPAIISEVEESYEGDFVLIADGYRESFARAFDGVHTYNICGWVRGKSPEELRDLSAANFRSAAAGEDQLHHHHPRVRRHEDPDARPQRRAPGRQYLQGAVGGGDQGRPGLGPHHLLERVVRGLRDRAKLGGRSQVR